MSDYSYADVFNNASGTILSSEFENEFDKIEIAVNSKADVDGPESYTGTHTHAGTITFSGNSSTGLRASAGATISIIGNITSTLGTISGLNLAGAADTTDIDGGTW